MTAKNLVWSAAPAWATHQLQDAFGQWHFVEEQPGGIYLEFVKYPEPAWLFCVHNFVDGSLEARPLIVTNSRWLSRIVNLVTGRPA